MRNILCSTAFFFVAVTCAASAQTVSFGVKGGVPIGGLDGTRDESRPYIVGPTFEIQLPANFAIEVDALYRRVGNSLSFITAIPPINGLYFNRDRGNSWEFPFLGKYYFRSHSETWRPFLAAGGSMRKTWFHGDSIDITPDQNGGTQTQKFHSSYVDNLGVGAAFAGGVEFRRGRLAFAPEVRYTRWASANFQRNARNEGGFLLGIRF